MERLAVKILMVDSSEMIRGKLKRYLELEKQFDKIYEAEFFMEAKKIIENENIDIILFDIQLLDDSGLEIVPFSRSIFPNPVLILFTNYKLPQYVNIYQQMSIHHCFDKSSDLAKLKLFIKNLVHEFNSHNQQNYPNNSN